MTTLVFPKHGVDTHLLCQKLRQNYFEYQHEGHYHVFLKEDDWSLPALIESLTKNPGIEKKLFKTLQDGRVFENGLLDKSAVMQAYRRTVEGTEDHSIFLNQILTLEYGLFSELQ